MSVPDYAQSLEDHRKVLILLRPLDSLILGDAFERIFDAISTYHALTPIPGHQDEAVPRSVQARFVRRHAPENNAWGEFQAHRQVLGLICVAGVGSDEGLDAACRAYLRCKEEYALTAVDGLLVLVEEGEADAVDFSRLSELLPFCSKDVLRCRADDPNLGPLHSRVRDFMIVLFWLLESQRLNWIQQQAGTPEPAAGGPLGRRAPASPGRLLTAPFEQREMVGLSRDSRQHQRRQAGRQRKHVADLCLLCGLPALALDYYHAALELLRAANDWLWVGACVEGQCAASAVVHYGTGDPVKAALRSTNQSAKEGRARPVGDWGDESALSEATRQLLDEQYMLAPDQDEWRSTNGGPGPEGEGRGPGGALPKHCLAQDAIVGKYREVMDQYKKYSLASVVCLEAGLKCCRVLICQQRRLEAATFLQQVLSVKLAPGEDAAVRYAVVARLYELMLFPRKAAFYRRMAGLERGRGEDPSAPADLLAFLRKAAAAYGLRLEEAERVGGGRADAGWPLLKVEHLHALAAAALATCHWGLAVSYCSYALDIGRSDLTDDRLASFLEMLEKAQAEAGEEKETVRPCFFTPQVDILKLAPLASHLQPTVTEAKRLSASKPKSPSPFIYSPLLAPKKQHVRSRSAGGCLDSRLADLSLLSGDSLHSDATVMWVCGEVCRLEMTLTNPLVRQIELSDVQLVFVPCGPDKSSPEPQLWALCAEQRVTLAPECFKTVTLPLEPRCAGRFHLRGWRYSLFGLRCQQDFPPGLGDPRGRLLVEVAPRLPRLEIGTDLQPADEFVQSEEGREKLVADGSLPLVRLPTGGKVSEFALRLSNPGAASCDVASLRLDFSNDIRICHQRSDYRKRCKVEGFVRWSEPEVECRLPMRTGASVELRIEVDPALLPESAVSVETLLTVEYSSSDAVTQGWCRRHAVGVVSDVSWATPVAAPPDPFAEVASPVLPTPTVTITQMTSVS